MNNRHRITFVSFLAYFVMSGALSPIGIIVTPMAEYFDRPVTEIAALFSWLTMGILMGSIAALFVFDWIAIKQLMLVLYSLVTLSFLSLIALESLLLIGLALGLVGLCCGIGLAGAASLISRLYEADRRASMLVITDGFFSTAGIVCSWIAVFLVAKHIHWAGSYQFVALIAISILILSWYSTFPEPPNNLQKISEPGSEDATAINIRPWPLPVYLCIAALFLYTLGQYSLLWWLPNYYETELGVPREQAGSVVGQFWGGMFAAQIFVAWWVLKIGVQKLVILGCISTTLCSIPLWIYPEIQGLVILAFIWGFANLGLLKILISLATLMVSSPSPRLISALLLGATSGTAVSPWITSQVVELSSPLFVLQFGTLCYVLLCLIILTSLRLFQRSGQNVKTQESTL